MILHPKDGPRVEFIAQRRSDERTRSADIIDIV